MGIKGCCELKGIAEDKEDDAPPDEDGVKSGLTSKLVYDKLC